MANYTQPSPKHVEFTIKTDRISVVRDAIMACRKGGIVSIMGVYSGFVDKFPLGAVMQKNLTLRSGQMHDQAYAPRLLGYVQQGQVDVSFLATHPMSLEDAKAGFETMRKKEDNCLRVVFHPN